MILNNWPQISQVTTVAKDTLGREPSYSHSCVNVCHHIIPDFWQKWLLIMANRVFSYVQNTAMMLLSPDPPIPQSGYHDFTHFTYEEMGRDVKPLTRL